MAASVILWANKRIDLTVLTEEELDKLYDHILNWGSSAVSNYEAKTWASGKENFRNRLAECWTAQQCIEAELKRREQLALVA